MDGSNLIAKECGPTQGWPLSPGSPVCSTPSTERLLAVLSTHACAYKFSFLALSCTFAVFLVYRRRILSHPCCIAYICHQRTNKTREGRSSLAVGTHNTNMPMELHDASVIYFLLQGTLLLVPTASTPYHQQQRENNYLVDNLCIPVVLWRRWGQAGRGDGGSGC